MRKPAVVPVAATEASSSAGRRGAVEMVCLALALALVTLASRIASIW
jgi:hypothetical protein